MTKRILALAIPNIISNISIPLLSIADTAIAGRMALAESLGAVALASIIVNFTYWLWGFLRMTTTGFTAQAYGRGDTQALSKQFSVGTSLALVGALVILALSPLLMDALALVGGEASASIIPEAERYLRVAYWGAPAALLLYVYNGWFVGMQDTVTPMYTTILSNIVNIGLSVIFVRYGGMGVEGIAWGTVVAQYLSIGLLLGVAICRHRHIFSKWQWRDFFTLGVIGTYLHIAKYLLLRTMMLGSISLYFVHVGGSYGPLVLGANALLMQLFTMFSYFMDGFAYAGEALTGRFIGAGDYLALRRMLRSLFAIGGIVAPLIAIIYYIAGADILNLLSDKPQIITIALHYRLWAVAIPLVAFMAFLWDGIFVGATNSRPMMQAVTLAWGLFFLTYLLLGRAYGVHALWLAFVIYLGVRSALSCWWGIRLVNHLEHQTHP